MMWIRGEHKCSGNINVLTNRACGDSTVGWTATSISSGPSNPQTALGSLQIHHLLLRSQFACAIPPHAFFTHCANRSTAYHKPVSKSTLEFTCSQPKGTLDRDSCAQKHFPEGTGPSAAGCCLLESTGRASFATWYAAPFICLLFFSKHFK